jgi:hypothetical protein
MINKKLQEIIEDVIDHEAVKKVDVYPALATNPISLFSAGPLKAQVQVRVYALETLVGIVEYSSVSAAISDMNELIGMKVQGKRIHVY